MTSADYIELNKSFLELPQLLNSIPGPIRKSAEKYDKLLSLNIDNITPYDAIVAEIDNLCSSVDFKDVKSFANLQKNIMELSELTISLGELKEAMSDISGLKKNICLNSLSDECRDIRSYCLKKMTFDNVTDAKQRISKTLMKIQIFDKLSKALERMDKAESNISTRKNDKNIAAIIVECQDIRIFCLEKITIDNVADTLDRVNQMTRNINETIKGENAEIVEKLMKIVEGLSGSVWNEDISKFKKKISSKNDLIDEPFLSSLNQGINNAKKRRTSDINDTLKKHRCLRPGGRYHTEHEALIHEKGLSFYKYEKTVNELVERSNKGKIKTYYIISAIVAIVCGIGIWWGLAAGSGYWLIFLILAIIDAVFLLIKYLGWSTFIYIVYHIIKWVVIVNLIVGFIVFVIWCIWCVIDD